MPTASVTLHVASDGADANPGTRAKPFATLERARDEIRALKKAGALPKGGIAVELAGGVYERTKPFTLSAEDSGSQDAPIVYRARRGEEVRLIGGRVVTGWKPVTDQAILDRLEPAARANVVQADLKALGISDLGGVNANRLELFFNDTPMTLARWPNDGFVKITGLVEPDTVNVRGTKGSKTGKFLYDGDRPKRWAGEKEPWVHGYWFWDWSDQRHPVESIDTEKRVIAVKPPYHGYGYRVGQWFYALNLLSEIDQPGEWVLDRETGVLYFWPPADIAKGRAVVSVAESLVTMKGVSHVTLRGFTLEACRGTAVSVEGGAHCAIAACTLRNLGGSAVRIAGATDSRVVGCDIYGVGDGGIALDGGDRKTLAPARLAAENNHIHHYGRWNRMYKAAIQIGGVGNRAAHNLIHNAPHMAIGFSGNDHVIEFNEIHSVCHESNDAGAMYAGRNWTMRGTVVRHNYLHHIVGFEGRGCVGVYLDDMFCGTDIVGNVFYKVTMAAFVGGGRDCTVANNLFVDCPRALHIDSRALGWARDHTDGWVKEGKEKSTHLGLRFKEPPYSTRWPQLLSILDDEPFAPKGNVVERNIFVGDRWSDVDGRAKPYVAMKDNLTDTDPLFVGKPPASFELRKDSPAWKLGFQRIPVEKIGLYNDANRASWPVEHARRPAPPTSWSRGAISASPSTTPLTRRSRCGRAQRGGRTTRSRWRFGTPPRARPRPSSFFAASPTATSSRAPRPARPRPPRRRPATPSSSRLRSRARIAGPPSTSSPSPRWALTPRSTRSSSSTSPSARPPATSGSCGAAPAATAGRSPRPASSSWGSRVQADWQPRVNRAIIP